MDKEAWLPVVRRHAMLQYLRKIAGATLTEAKIWPEPAIHLLRTTQQHHVQLSLMADQKANMLIGATFVVFTLAIGQSRLGEFSIPLLVLAISSFASAALAAMAVMPSTVPKSTNNPNWLFFGAFSQIDEEEFTTKIMDGLDNPDIIFRTMIRDIYQMGCILNDKKYRYLGWAYRVFLVGLTLTFLTFVYERIMGPIL